MNHAQVVEKQVETTNDYQVLVEVRHVGYKIQMEIARLQLGKSSCSRPAAEQ